MVPEKETSLSRLLGYSFLELLFIDVCIKLTGL
jgi:hypothetical protein